MDDIIITDVAEPVIRLANLGDKEVSVLWLSKPVAALAEYLHSIDAEPISTIRVRKSPSLTEGQYRGVVKNIWDRGQEPIDWVTGNTIHLDVPNQGCWKWNGVNDYIDEFTELTPLELI